jgi:hypothetical protein
VGVCVVLGRASQPYVAWVRAHDTRPHEQMNATSLGTQPVCKLVLYMPELLAVSRLWDLQGVWYPT